jgi:tetratricopeptide (TPR) repeat protein
MGIFFYLALTAVRNIPVFMLVALPISAACLRDMKPRWEGWAGKQFPFSWSRWGLPVVLTLLFLLFGPRIVTDAYYLSDRRPDRFGLGLEMDQMPVGAANFLNQNHLDGKIINMSNFGGWFDWAAPQPTFIDGRWEIQNGDLYRQYLKMAFQKGLAQGAQAYQPQLIVFEPRYPPSWVDQLNQMPGWRPIYLDGCAAIYAKEDYAPQVSTLTEPDILHSYGLQPLGDETEMVNALRSIQPSPFHSWLEGFYKKQSYSLGLLNGGVFSSGWNQPALARVFYLEMLRQTGGVYEELWFNLANECLKLNEIAAARVCYQKILEIDPGNGIAKKILYKDL